MQFAELIPALTEGWYCKKTKKSKKSKKCKTHTKSHTRSKKCSCRC